MEAARDQRRAGVVAEAETVADARRDGDDVLERAAQLDADDVLGGVRAEAVGVEDVLHLLGDLVVLARDAHRRGDAHRDFLREAGTAEEAEEMMFVLGELLFEDLAHHHQGRVLDALDRGADRSLVGEEGSGLFQHRANAVGGHHREDHLRAGDGLRELTGRREGGRQLEPGEVSLVLPRLVDGVGLLLAPCPEPHLVALIRELLCESGPPRAGPEDRDLLLVHARDSYAFGGVLQSSVLNA